MEYLTILRQVANAFYNLLILLVMEGTRFVRISFFKFAGNKKTIPFLQFESISSFSTDAVIIETGDVTASVFIIEIDLENSVASKAVQPPLPSPVSWNVLILDWIQ